MRLQDVKCTYSDRHFEVPPVVIAVEATDPDATPKTRLTEKFGQIKVRFCDERHSKRGDDAARIVSLLITNGANVNGRLDDAETMARCSQPGEQNLKANYWLMLKAVLMRHGQIALVQLLCGGADIDCADAHSYTALHHSIIGRTGEFPVHLLLHFRANVNTVCIDESGARLTPLHLTVQKRRFPHHQIAFDIGR